MIYLNRTDCENHRSAKLTADEVRQIRREYDAGKRGKERAKHFGISPSYFSQIGKRKVWRNLPVCAFCEGGPDLTLLCPGCDEEKEAGRLGRCSECGDWFYTPDEIRCKCWEAAEYVPEPTADEYRDMEEERAREWKGE